MSVLVYLVPLALGLGLTGLFTFLWALRSGQFDDPHGASIRILADDDVQGIEKEHRILGHSEPVVPMSCCL